MGKFLKMNWIAMCAVMMAFGVFFPALVAMAQEAAVAVAAAPAPVVEVPITNIFQDALKAIGDWKALGWQAGIAGILTVLISTMKNSLLRGLIWDKLPTMAKLLVAPVLALLAFFLGLGKLDGATILMAITTGAASVYIHQLLDAVKEIPGVGPKYQWLIDLLAKLLKKPAAAAKPAA
jgi:hypothetical protein